VLGSVLGVLVAGLVTITVTGYNLGLVDAGNADIYAYQSNKIDRMAKVDVIFVGDSSLGNAIDAGYFKKLSGLATANLAMTGSYGSGGSLNMIRRVLEKNHHPGVVVIMQSITTMTKRAFAGFFFSSSLADKVIQPPDRILEIYLNLNAAEQIIKQVRKKGLHVSHANIVNDYLEQTRISNRLAPLMEVKEKPLLPDMIAESQINYLTRIAEICSSAGLICIYAHGPIFEGYCQQSLAYLEELNARIRAIKLRILEGTPICVKQNELGNSIDHVRPDLKQSYTRRYFDLLKGIIDRATAAIVSNQATASSISDD
jgi:hypothetical protein